MKEWHITSCSLLAPTTFNSTWEIGTRRSESFKPWWEKRLAKQMGPPASQRKSTSATRTHNFCSNERKTVPLSAKLHVAPSRQSLPYRAWLLQKQGLWWRVKVGCFEPIRLHEWTANYQEVHRDINTTRAGASIATVVWQHESGLKLPWSLRVAVHAAHIRLVL